MSSQYPYPPDEFDMRAEGVSPVGVHRVRPSTWSRIRPYVLVALLFAVAAGVGIWAMVGNHTIGGNDPGSGIVEATPEPTEPTTPPEPEPEPQPEAPTLDSLLAAADLTIPIQVLNASGIQGEAGRGAARLEAQGFTSVAPGNFPGTPPTDTTAVWYIAGQEATAQAVAAVLGLPTDVVVEHELQTAQVAVLIRQALPAAE